MKYSLDEWYTVIMNIKESSFYKKMNYYGKMSCRLWFLYSFSQYRYFNISIILFYNYRPNLRIVMIIYTVIIIMMTNYFQLMIDLQVKYYNYLS